MHRTYTTFFLLSASLHDNGPILIKRHFYLIWPLISIFLPHLLLLPTVQPRRAPYKRRHSGSECLSVLERPLTTSHKLVLPHKILLVLHSGEDCHRRSSALDPRVTAVRPLLRGGNPCQDVWLCSLSTWTTSNPCHADWPVNCCNAQSRARRRSGVPPRHHTVTVLARRANSFRKQALPVFDRNLNQLQFS